MVLLVAFIVGCSVLLRSGGDEEGGPGEQTELTTMTFDQFQSIELGQTQDALEEEYGTPVPRQTVIEAGVIPDDPLTANCVYYKADPPTFGEWFEFCFDAGTLSNKNSL